MDDGIYNYAASDRFTEAEKLMLEYSELMATDPDAIDAAFYDRLRQHFTETEVVELGLFVAFNLGYHTFFGTLDFYPMFSPDGQLVSQEESRRAYGEQPASLVGATAEAAE